MVEPVVIIASSWWLENTETSLRISL